MSHITFVFKRVLINSEIGTKRWVVSNVDVSSWQKIAFWVI